MDQERWNFSMVLFLKKINIQTLLGVNGMRIKRNDYAPKVNVLIFLIDAQKINFEKIIKTKI